MPNNEISKIDNEKKISILDIWKTEVAYRQALHKRKKAHNSYNIAKKRYDETEAERMSANTGYTAKKRFYDEKSAEFSKIDSELKTAREGRELLREKMNQAYDCHKKAKQEIESLKISIESVDALTEENRKQEQQVKDRIRQLKDDIETLKEKKKDLSALKAALNQKKKELKEKSTVPETDEEDELKSLKKELASLEKKAEKINDRSDGFRAELLLLENEERECETLVSRLTDDQSITEAEIEEHKESSAGLKERSKKLARESVELKEKAENLITDYHRLSNKLDEKRLEAKKERESFIYCDTLDELERAIKEAAGKMTESRSLEVVDEYANLLMKYDFFQKAEKNYGTSVNLSPLKMSSLDGDSSMYMTVTYEDEGREEVIYISYTAIGSDGKKVVRGRWEYVNPIDHMVFYRREPKGSTGEIPIFKDMGEEFYNSESFGNDASTDYIARIRRKQNEVNLILKEMENQKKERSELMKKTEELRKDAASKLSESDDCLKRSENEQKSAVEKTEVLKNLKTDLKKAEKELNKSRTAVDKKKAELDGNEEKLQAVKKEEEPFISRIAEINKILEEKYKAEMGLKTELEETVDKIEEADRGIKECNEKKKEADALIRELKEKEEYHSSRYDGIREEQKQQITQKEELEKTVSEKLKEMELLDDELTETGSRVKELEKKAMTLQTEMNELEAETQERRQKADEAAAEFEKARVELENAVKEMDESIAQVDFSLMLQKTYLGRFLTGK